MGLWVVQHWSVREADKSRCAEALQVIADHIKAEHPEILSVRTQMQWVGSQAHRGFLWAEEYESLTGADSGEHTPACDEVWEPVHQMTMPGTHQRSVWFDMQPSWTR